MIGNTIICNSKDFNEIHFSSSYWKLPTRSRFFLGFYLPFFSGVISADILPFLSYCQFLPFFLPFLPCCQGLWPNYSGKSGITIGCIEPKFASCKTFIRNPNNKLFHVLFSSCTSCTASGDDLVSKTLKKSFVEIKMMTRKHLANSNQTGGVWPS